METHTDKIRDIAHYIFSGSTTMIGVCITVITLFMVIGNPMRTIADEILSIDTLFFIISALLSYLSLRGNNKKLELAADIFFFVGMLIMVAVGILIVYFEI